MRQNSPRLARWLVSAGLVAVITAVSPPAAFSESPENTAAADREARVQEYLRNKEAKRLEKERRRLEKEATRAAEAEVAAAAAAEKAAADEVARQEAEAAAMEAKLARDLAREQEAAGKQAERAAAGKSDLPGPLAKAQANVRASRLGADPTVRGYLDLVDAGEASAYQLAALGNFLAEAGMREDSMVYYQVALKLKKDDPLLWTNAGTLYRQMGDAKSGAGAYSRALSYDSSNAVAHYNLGAALDEMGKYDEAMQEYRMALTLDPSLGDPATNPQAAHNDRLMAVKLLVFQEQAGSTGLPLEPIPTSVPPGKDD